MTPHTEAAAEQPRIGEPYVFDFGRHAAVPCHCGLVSLFCASLIPQPWMQDKSHIWSTNCNCGKYYYSFAKDQVLECKT